MADWRLATCDDCARLEVSATPAEDAEAVDAEAADTADALSPESENSPV